MYRLMLLHLSALLLLMPALRAQSCSELFEFFREGVFLEYTHYDKKGKAETTHSHRVKQLEKSRDTVIAHTEVIVKQVKGDKEVSKYTVPIKCHEGTLFFSMRNVLPPVEAAQSPDMQVEFAGSDLSYPRNMRAGDRLPDSEMEMTVRMGSMQLMRNRYAIRDRRVEAEETVTTPAGTFKCYKISSTFEYQMLGKRTSREETWYSPSVGTVKSVFYDGKGREESRMELTKFSK